MQSNLPQSLSASEIQRRNEKHWNVPPPAPAPAPESATSAPAVLKPNTPFPPAITRSELASRAQKEFGAPRVKEATFPRFADNPPPSSLPEKISQRELAENFLSPSEHSDQVALGPGQPAIGEIKPKPNAAPAWSWWGSK
jgi:hypothetical protein